MTKVLKTKGCEKQKRQQIWRIRRFENQEKKRGGARAVKRSRGENESEEEKQVDRSERGRDR